MTLDHRNEPQPGEAERPEAPVIRAWRIGPYGWSFKAPGEPIQNAPYAMNPNAALNHFQAQFPGHTIDLSAEPPEPETLNP